MSYIGIINYSECEYQCDANQDGELNNKTPYDNVEIVRQDNQIETISQQFQKQFFDDELDAKETKLAQNDKPCGQLIDKNIKNIQKKIKKSKKKNPIQTNNHDVPLEEVDPAVLEEVSAYKDGENQILYNSIIVKSLTKISKKNQLKKGKKEPKETKNIPKKTTKETKNIPKETKNIAKNFANALKSYIKQIKNKKLKSTYCVRKFLKTPPNQLGLQQFRQYLKKNQLLRQIAEHFFGSCGWVSFFLKNNKTDIDLYFRHLNIWKE